MTLQSWIDQATQQLQAVAINSARLDAEIILAHTLRRSRTYLHAHYDDKIDNRQRDIADARLQLRIEHTPIAYIVGHKEFYGRLFRVSPAVLIPRPESEVLIDLLLEYTRAHSVQQIVDVGAGSGCLGITTKLELPDTSVTLIDSSRHALTVAQQNARLLRADVQIVHGDLLHSYHYTADCIIANLPYVDPDWSRSPETAHEPDEALFAADRGLSLINRLIVQAPTRLTPGGIVLIEAARIQHAAIIDHALQYGLRHDTTRGLIVQLHRP